MLAGKAIGRVGEVDVTVSGYHQVVGAVEVLVLKGLHDGLNAALAVQSREPPVPLLAQDEVAIAVDGQAV